MRLLWLTKSTSCCISCSSCSWSSAVLCSSVNHPLLLVIYRFTIGYVSYSFLGSAIIPRMLDFSPSESWEILNDKRKSQFTWFVEKVSKFSVDSLLFILQLLGSRSTTQSPHINGITTGSISPYQHTCTVQMMIICYISTEFSINVAWQTYLYMLVHDYLCVCHKYTTTYDITEILSWWIHIISTICDTNISWENYISFSNEMNNL